jgi:hypothetical protein
LPPFVSLIHTKTKMPSTVINKKILKLIFFLKKKTEKGRHP